MLSAVFALLLAGNAALAAIPTDAAYYGCNINSGGNTIPANQASITTYQQCIAACVSPTCTPQTSAAQLQNGGTCVRFAYWQAFTKKCQCNHMGGWPQYTVSADPAVCGSTSTTTNQWQSYYSYGTTFTSVSCADTFTRPASEPALVGNAPGSPYYPPYLAGQNTSPIVSGGQGGTEPQFCAGMCAKYPYFVLRPNTATNGGAYYECYCLNTAPSNPTTTVCAQQSYYLYTHPPAAQASALPRKRAEAARAAQQQALLDANPYCPIGFEACNVSDNRGADYECIATDSELESCGGCRYGRFGSRASNSTSGIDCTQIRGVNPRRTACIQGECVAFGCASGHRLVGEQCLRL